MMLLKSCAMAHMENGNSRGGKGGREIAPSPSSAGRLRAGKRNGKPCPHSKEGEGCRSM